MINEAAINNYKKLFDNFLHAVPDAKAVFLLTQQDATIECSSLREGVNGKLNKPVIAQLTTIFDRLANEQLVAGGGTSILEFDDGRFVYVRVNDKIACFVFDVITYVDKVLPYVYLTAEKVKVLSLGKEAELDVPSIEPDVEDNLDHEVFMELLSTSTSLTYKAIVLGDQAVGKTSLILRYSKGKFGFNSLPTIGVSITTHPVEIPLSAVRLNLQIWDLGGQDQFRRIRQNYYSGANVSLLVFDVTNRDSLVNLIRWNDERKQFAGDIPAILVGNKNDLFDKRVVSKEEAEAFAAKLNLPYMETSALTGANVGEIFKLAGFKVLNREAKKAGFGAMGDQ
ncbi:GTP-binding protein [Candidatus Bathyarchaeota archaeon]|nr:GTP-binding protein [Candidatus Bathyarchaeota archaeon]